LLFGDSPFFYRKRKRSILGDAPVLTETHQVTENVTENKFTETVTETVNFHRKRHPCKQEIRKAHRKIPSVCLIKVLFLRILHVSANG
jgi:hypothetical protein